MVITGASVVLFLLVILRISGLVRQQERAAVREHVLQSAGAALVAATTTREIYDAALSALPELLGPGAEARLCVPDGEDLALLGCDADAPLQPLSVDAGQVRAMPCRKRPGLKRHARGAPSAGPPGSLHGHASGRSGSGAVAGLGAQQFADPLAGRDDRVGVQPPGGAGEPLDRSRY